MQFTTHQIDPENPVYEIIMSSKSQPMKQLKLLRNSLLPVLLLLVTHIASVANNPDEPATEDEVRIQEIEVRLDELTVKTKALKVAKKEAETKAERKAIKEELKSIRDEAKALDAEGKALSGGIYIGAGALVVILLLILLL